MTSRLATMPRSRIDWTWPGAGQPEELTKVEAVMPRARPRSVIWAANASSDPARPSATTTQASLPELMMIPLISSSTVGLSCSFRNMVDPRIALARADTAKVVSMVTRPSRSASNSMFSVISLDIEAGGRAWSAFLSRRTVPDFTS
jgi:hypothetical protein